MGSLKEKPLGSTGEIERLVQAGRVPNFYNEAVFVQGFQRTRIKCVIPGVNGQKPRIEYLSLQNATQIKRRMQHVLGQNQS